MKRFLYPCVIYYDEENEDYAVAFHDLGVFTEAETVEKAYIRAKLFLEAYCEASEEMEADYPVPTNFLELQKKHPNDIVQLVYAEVGDVVSNVKEVPIEELMKDEVIEDEIVPGKPFKLKTIE
ncbi:MAG: hypothetical protein KBT30_00795 [Clostridiales bacterium]|nr:hypothetical protein [Candidatus Apopatousia equi]